MRLLGEGCDRRRCEVVRNNHPSANVNAIHYPHESRLQLQRASGVIRH
jgi:hypothetical protein